MSVAHLSGWQLWYLLQSELLAGNPRSSALGGEAGSVQLGAH